MGPGFRRDDKFVASVAAAQHVPGGLAFAAHGLEVPNISMRTLSVHMRIQLIATGDFITTLPRSVLRLYAARLSLKALAVDFPARPWPVSIITLKHRLLSPIVHRFIRCAEDVAKEIDGQPRSRKSP